MKRALAHAIVFFIGVAAALTATNYADRGEALSRDLNDAAAFSARVMELQADAKSTDRVRAEKALWLQLGEQLAFARRSNQSLSPDIVFLEAAYNYARLAELAQERSDDAASRMLLEDAVSTCKKSKSVNCQAQSLQKLIRVFDGKEKP